MTPEDLRKKWMDENKSKYGELWSFEKPFYTEKLWSFEKPFYTEKLCCGNGRYRDIECSNAEYTKWLEKIIIGGE